MDHVKDVVAVLALLLSVVNAIILFFHNRKMKAMASAGPELTVLATINASRAACQVAMKEIYEHLNGRNPEDLDPTEKVHFERLVSLHEGHLELLLNSYELACRLYRAHKLDRASFKGQYSEEIRRIFNFNPNEGLGYFKKRLDTVSSHYKALKAVFDEWTSHD